MANLITIAIRYFPRIVQHCVNNMSQLKINHTPGAELEGAWGGKSYFQFGFTARPDNGLKAENADFAGHVHLL